MNWIEKRQKQANLDFEKMKTKYYIPEKYKDASDIFFKNSIDKLKLKNPNYKQLKELIDDWNKIYEEVQYKIPKEIGEELEQNYSNSNYVLGIHRTDLSIEQVQNDIFISGLKNRSNEYNTTIQTFKYFPLMLNEIINCNNYKMSQGCVIVKLPKDQKLPIYYINENNYYLLPEYVYGYINVLEGEVKSFIKNSNYKEVHDYSPNGLVFDEILEIEKQRKIG